MVKIPIEEEIDEEEERRLPLSNEMVLVEFGLTLEDFERILKLFHRWTTGAAPISAMPLRIRALAEQASLLSHSINAVYAAAGDVVS